MDIIIAFLLLSVVVIVPTLTGVFLRGRGALLRVLGAFLDLPLLVVLVRVTSSEIFDFNYRGGDPWRAAYDLVLSMIVGIVGAIIGGIGRAQAAK